MVLVAVLSPRNDTKVKFQPAVRLTGLKAPYGESGLSPLGRGARIWFPATWSCMSSMSSLKHFSRWTSFSRVSWAYMTRGDSLRGWQQIYSRGLHGKLSEEGRCWKPWKDKDPVWARAGENSTCPQVSQDSRGRPESNDETAAGGRHQQMAGLAAGDQQWSQTKMPSWREETAVLALP